jgi:hypothetical protein
MADEIDFHSKRAMAELDRGVGAECHRAARAHFALSALHLERMRQLVETGARLKQAN